MSEVPLANLGELLNSLLIWAGASATFRALPSILRDVLSGGTRDSITRYSILLPLFWSARNREPTQIRSFYIGYLFLEPLESRGWSAEVTLHVH